LSYSLSLIKFLFSVVYATIVWRIKIFISIVYAISFVLWYFDCLLGHSRIFTMLRVITKCEQCEPFTAVVENTNIAPSQVPTAITKSHNNLCSVQPISKDPKVNAKPNLNRYFAVRLVSEAVVDRNSDDHVIHDTSNSPDIAGFTDVTFTIISEHLRIHYGITNCSCLETEKEINRMCCDWVLQKAETKPHLLQTRKKRKLSFYGHALRKEGSCRPMRRKLYKVLRQVKDTEEDQRPIGMTTSWSGLG